MNNKKAPLSEPYSAKKTTSSSSIQTKFIGISIVLITILLFSTIAHPINAFKSPSHSDITDESLGFLLSDVLDKIISTNVDVDETNKGNKFHLYNCDFQGSTENINNLYDQLVTNIQNIDAPETFGLLLHPIQDFYAHSNWVELGRNDLIDNGDGKWIVLKPFQEYKGVIIVQVEDKNDIPEGYTLVQVEDKNDIPEGYTLSENGKVVYVSSQSGNHPGLISTTFGYNDFCPEDVALDHDILHKDNSDRPGYDQARALAKAQTIHEWCRLTNLVEQSYGQDGVQLLFNSWVDDKDKANSVCLSDGSSLNTDVEDNSYVKENDIKNNGKTLFGEFIANDGSVIDQFKLHTLQGNSYQEDKILLEDKNANDNFVICDKLASFGKVLFDEWEQGHITDEQAILLEEQAKILMTESRCIN